jgi:hypothetical protein
MRLITIILLLFFCFSITNVFGNDNKPFVDTIKRTVKKQHWKNPSIPHIKHEIPKSKLYYNDCVFTNRYTISQRLRKYPFSKAVKILAISYDGTGEGNEPLILASGDTVDEVTHKKFIKHKPQGLYFKSDTLDYVSTFEIKQLTPQQINRLTNILYNTDVRIHNDYADPSHSCFNPRNALIFFDKNGKVFDYLEICFECEKIESKSGEIYFNSACNQGLDLVKKFLIDLGIKYGTVTKKYPE